MADPPNAGAGGTGIKWQSDDAADSLLNDLMADVAADAQAEQAAIQAQLQARQLERLCRIHLKRRSGNWIVKRNLFEIKIMHYILINLS